MKKLIKEILERTPYRIVRAAQNRFQAAPHALKHLRGLGYMPKVIIDGGAHLGEFARECASVWPDAQIHMVEPQVACHSTLRTLPYRLHPAALGASCGSVEMTGSETPSTGVAILDGGGTTVPLATLDSFVRLTPGDRAFLKLDLQGHEIEALKGAEESLRSIEFIFSEISFFTHVPERLPLAAELINYLNSRGFVLFDIAALGGRGRDDRLKQGDFIFVHRDSQIARDSAWD